MVQKYPNLYCKERQEDYIEMIIKDTKKDIRDYGVEEAWQGAYGFFLDAHFGHDIAYKMAKRLFERLGYTVE